MKKPKKKITPQEDFDGADHAVPIEVEAYNEGFNQSCDIWEAFLPDKQEIKSIGWLVLSRCDNLDGDILDALATAIAQRIGTATKERKKSDISTFLEAKRKMHEKSAQSKTVFNAKILKPTKERKP